LELDLESVGSPCGVLDEELEDFLALGRCSFRESVVEVAGEFDDGESGREVLGLGGFEALDFFLDGATLLLEFACLFLDGVVVEVEVEDA
jgi:hypothetical protein